MPDAGGSQADLMNSLELLGQLEPDVVISSASVGQMAFKKMAPGEWREVIQDTLRSLP
jgi:hypothetical protein